MTDREAKFSDHALEAWLSQQQPDLLDSVIDVEAGLREILLQSRHDAMVDSLDAVIDVEAGLAAVLPPAPGPATDGHRATRSARQRREFLSVERLLMSVSPHRRIALRGHPEVLLGYEALEGLRKIEHYMRESFQCAGQLGDLLTSHHAIDFDLALSLSLKFEHTIQITREYCSEICAFVRKSIAYELLCAVRDVQTFATNLSRSVAQASEYAHACDTARKRNKRLRTGEGTRARQVSRELAYHFDQALAKTRRLTEDLPSIMLRGEGGVQSFAIACVQRVRRTLAREIGHHRFPTLSLEEFREFLDNFTMSDLRDAALEGIDLGGVRWSVHQTLWPEAVEVDDLKARSDETFPGSGIYVIRSGTAMVRDFAGLL
ncbi:hypothetical protein [Streptomyces sioyaensis]|uniref:hypothetical protein n=1 Tax=Streptomyces sioyaensis TaxID=67364 RepID=UPI003719D79E